MPEKSTQPTVLVKKADGTFARVSLGELKRPSSVKPTSALPRPRVPSSVPLTPSKPMQSPAPSKAKAPPFRPLPPRPQISKVTPPPLSPLKKDDFKSPLEEEEELNTLEKRPAPPPTRVVIPQVVKKSPLSVSTPVVSVFEHPRRAVATPPKSTPAVRPPATLPASPPASAKISPRVAARNDSANFHLRSEPATKPPMRDIIKPKEMGPVDEIRYFTLVDFRRLAPDAPESARRLKQKLINLRDESYVWYMEALAAWRESPLFADYVRAVAGALKSGSQLAAVTGEKGKIQLNEIKALVEMEKQLG